MEPIIGFVSAIGEGTMWLLQTQILGMEKSNVFVKVKPGEDILASTITYAGAGAAIGGGTAAGIAGTTGSFVIPVLGTAVGTGVGAIAGGVIGGLIGGIVGFGSGVFNYFFVNKEFSYYFPLYSISPQEIFADQIPALHINFLNPKDYEEETQDNDGLLPVYNSAKILSPQISKWYVALRNIVLIGLMVVLLYIGIRIIISSTAGEKAKYKEHIKDWLVAVILVVFMHYIMAFALTITEYITNMLNNGNDGIAITVDENQIKQIFPDNYEDYKIAGAENAYAVKTNLLGYVRFHQQYDRVDENGNPQVTWNYIGLTIIYLVLIIYTVMFLIIYFKRVIYMAFLTVIAPLVALTYPIDKISDGQAQAFNMWLKEYIYNLLLQPFHLLLYTLLIGSAIDLAANNMLYALVALGFLIPAEKLLRRFFGFDQKAPEAGSIVGGVVGGSLAMNAINSMRRIGAVPQKGGKSLGASEGKEDDSGKTRLTDRKPDSDKKESIESLLEDGNTKNENLKNGDLAEETGKLRLTNNASTLAGDSSVDNSEVNQKFNPNSDFELFKTPRNDIESQANEFSPIRGLKDNISGKIQNRIENVPKTKLGRDAKRLVIRGATTGGKTVKAALGTGMHYTGKALQTVGKRVPRLATKAALGAALGTAGVAAGIASGDLSNIATYGVAAAGVGASVGEGVSNIVGNVGNTANSVIREANDDYMRRRYTKDERQAIQNRKEDAEWRKSKDVIKMYKDEFGKDYRTAMDKAQKYREFGITNDKATIKNLKSTGLDGDPSREDIATTKIAASVSTEKDLKGVTDRLRNNGVAEDKIKNIEKEVRKMNISGNFV